MSFSGKSGERYSVSKVTGIAFGILRAVSPRVKNSRKFNESVNELEKFTKEVDSQVVEYEAIIAQIRAKDIDWSKVDTYDK